MYSKLDKELKFKKRFGQHAICDSKESSFSGVSWFLIKTRVFVASLRDQGLVSS